MRRAACYIDGFNLYHSIADLNQPHLKWVNLQQLATTLLRRHQTLIKTHYFSAYATWLLGPYNRHLEYTSALEAVGVQVTMAHFKDKRESCKSCGNVWTRHEEKETDVHLALWLLRDAEDDVFDDAILISADSDLVPPVRMIKERHSDKRVIIATPPGRYNSARSFMAEADGYFEITRGRVRRSLFPGEVFTNEGNLVATRPSEYDPPQE